MREMKDIGIEWIGEIPKDWKVCKLKNISRIQTGNTPSKTQQTEFYSDESGIPWIKAEDLGTSKGVEFTTEYLTEVGAENGRVFPPNTVYVCCIASIGKTGFSNIKCSCNQQINGIIFDGAYWKYGYYMTLAQESEYILGASGNVVKILNTEKQSNIVCPLPTKDEQKRIADYLDKKCAKIDAIIEKQQEIIEKLREYKLSVITEAVTKGLTTSAVLKNCEVPGVETIPESWEVEKLKYFTEVISKGTTPSTVGRDINDEGPVRFFKAENIQNNRVCKKPEFFIDEETNDFLNRSQLTDRDILFVIAGATIGKTAIISDDCLPANTNQAVSFIRINDKRNRKYVWYSLQSLHMKTMLAVKATQAAQPNLAMEDLGNYPIFLPTKAEMERIIDYLDKKCDVIDETIISKSRIIEKFQEYKQSLIYEAVTGKREV